MLKYRSLTYLVLAVFALTICAGFGTTQAYAAITLSDVSGHWAQSQIESLVEQNVVSGYPDNTFKPDNPVTRVEFMVMANRAFSFTNTANIDYSDVPADAWYAPEVAKAKAAGYISGYQDGSMKPNNQISRQEAAAMIARALQLDTTGDIPLNFTDAASIPTWSKNAIAAVAKAGCISGYPDGTFKATNSITRAEAVIMLSRSMAVIAPTTTYDKAGTYGPETGKATVEGNVTISAPGVVLQNTEITGNLLIAESVGEGDVTLKNVTVKGTTTVKGGGENSIKVENCSLGTVNVNKAKGTVRIVVSGTTTVVQVITESGAILEESNLTTGNGIAGVTITGTGAVILNGDFDSVIVEGANANVTVTGGTVASLTVADSAAGANLKVTGGATITTLTANAAAAITGNGKIITANYNANGITTTIKPTNVNTAEGVTEPTPSKPAGGGGGGGGGGGSETADFNNWLNGLLTMVKVYGIYSDNLTVQLGDDHTPTTISVKDTIKDVEFGSLLVLAIDKIAGLTDESIKVKLVDELSTNLTAIKVTQSDQTYTLAEFMAKKLEGKPNSAAARKYFNEPTLANYNALVESLKNHNSYEELVAAAKAILPFDQKVTVPVMTVKNLKLTKIVIKKDDAHSREIVPGGYGISIDDVRKALDLPPASTLTLGELKGSNITYTFTGSSDHNYTFSLTN